MKYALLLSILTLSFPLPAHTMEVQEFHNIFIDTREAISPWCDAYLTTINNTLKEAANKKEALLQLQLAIAARKADGVTNHILVYGKKASAIDLNDETLNRTFNDLMTNHAKTLVELLNYYETLCKADILRVQLALESRIGMCSDSDPAKIIQNTQLYAIEAYWRNTHKNLDLMKMTDGGKKLLGLLVQKEPVPIEEFDSAIKQLGQEQTISLPSITNDAQ
jgi:hypothetical protein